MQSGKTLTWIAALAAFALSLHASTNVMLAPLNYRVVTGQVFRVDQSVKWNLVQFEVLDVRREGVVARRLGWSRGLPVGAVWLIPDYPTNRVAMGQTPLEYLMPTGTTNLDGKPVEVWNYGQRYWMTNATSAGKNQTTN